MMRNPLANAFVAPRTRRAPIARVVRTVDTPRALPLGTTVLDADGARLVRVPEGWRHITKTGDITGEPVSTLDLAYPLAVLAPRKPYHQTRTERRAVERAADKAAAPEAADKALRGLAKKRKEIEAETAAKKAARAERRARLAARTGNRPDFALLDELRGIAEDGMDVRRTSRDTVELVVPIRTRGA